MLQILILAFVAAFLFWRLWSVLGTRSGHESDGNISIIKPKKSDIIKDVKIDESSVPDKKTSDEDIADYIEIDSESGVAFSEMKKAETTFTVAEFVSGAKQAYEMILMSFERGDLETLKNLLSEEVFKSFESVVSERAKTGVNIDANFVGMREIRVKSASFNADSKFAEVTMFFKSELTIVVKDKDGKVIEGDPDKIKKQSDLWTFGRSMGKDNPNWYLIDTAVDN